MVDKRKRKSWELRLMSFTAVNGNQILILEMLLLICKKTGNTATVASARGVLHIVVKYYHSVALRTRFPWRVSSCWAATRDRTQRAKANHIPFITHATHLGWKWQNNPAMKTWWRLNYQGKIREVGQKITLWEEKGRQYIKSKSLTQETPKG